MRAVALLVVVGCGGTTAHEPDASPPIAPRVIAGGGIADGPVTNGINVYVIDDFTRMPIAGATVGVGALTGTTDATGLFVAAGVTGPQTVYAKKFGYNTAAWFGVDGSNVTIDVQQLAPVIGSATVSGAVLGLDTLTVPPGHVLSVRTGYSLDDRFTDAQNYVAQSSPVYGCDLADVTQPCNFTFHSRVGSVALFAVIYDQDPNAHTFTVIGWADRTHVSVVNGVDQTGLDLALIPASQYAMVTVDFPQPPPMFSVGANPAIELGTDGTIQLPPVTPSAPTLLVPDLTVVPGSHYRVIATASYVPSSADTEVTTTTRRGLAGPTLAVGGWLPVPHLTVAPRLDQVSWDPNPDARIAGFDVFGAGRLVVRTFDGSSSVAIPAAVRLTGSPYGVVDAIGGDFDPQSFSFDDPAVAMHSSFYVDVTGG